MSKGWVVHVCDTVQPYCTDYFQGHKPGEATSCEIDTGDRPASWHTLTERTRGKGTTREAARFLLWVLLSFLVAPLWSHLPRRSPRGRQLLLQRRDSVVLVAQLRPRERQEFLDCPVPAAAAADVLPCVTQLDVPHPRRELQCARRLRRVARRRARVHQHQRLAVSTQARRQDVRQLAVTEGHVSAARLSGALVGLLATGRGTADVDTLNMYGAKATEQSKGLGLDLETLLTYDSDWRPHNCSHCIHCFIWKNMEAHCFYCFVGKSVK